MFKPLGERLLVKTVEQAKKTAAGIILPDNTKNKIEHGEVVQIGEGFFYDNGTRRPHTVSVGDKIGFLKHAGVEVRVNHETLLVLKESDVLGVFKG